MDLVASPKLLLLKIKPLYDDWSKLVEDQKNPYHKPIMKCLILIPTTICENASILWNDGLVRQFVGCAPSHSHIHGAANLLYGTKGKVEIIAMGMKHFSSNDETFLFKFEDVATRNWVIISGPWYIGQQLVFLRK